MLLPNKHSGQSSKNHEPSTPRNQKAVMKIVERKMMMNLRFTLDDKDRICGSFRFTFQLYSAVNRISSEVFPGARLCEPQQHPHCQPPPFISCAFRLAKLLRVTDPRSVRKERRRFVGLTPGKTRAAPNKTDHAHNQFLKTQSRSQTGAPTHFGHRSFPGARLCEPQQRPNCQPPQFISCAFWLAKITGTAGF